LLPPLPKGANTNRVIRFTPDVSHVQQIILFAKREKVGEKGVEVRLSTKMEDLVKVCMVDMGKDTKELAVDVFDGCGEGWMEWLIAFGRKYVLIFS